jgi:AraC-like DNA-binding protein
MTPDHRAGDGSVEMDVSGIAYLDLKHEESAVGTMHLDTRSVMPQQRSAFWNDAVQSVLHVDSETTVLGDKPLETALDKYDIGDLSILAVRGSPQRVVARDWTRANSLGVLLPQTPGGFIETKGRMQALQPGHAYIVNFRGPFLIQAPDMFEHIYLVFPSTSSKLARTFIDRNEQASLPLDSGAPAVFANALHTLFRNAPQISSVAAPTVARSMIELLDAALLDAQAGRDGSAPRLEEYHRQRIRQHALAELRDPDLSVESIAAAVGLSVRRIHQLFADTEMTLMRWIWSERLARCHSGLVDASIRGERIGGVAYEWGFSDPAHFSRAFRQRYGVSPSQVLRQRPSLGQLTLAHVAELPGTS